MNFRTLGATAIAAALVAVAAPAMLVVAPAYAQNGQAKPAAMSKGMVTPMNAAAKALQAKDWATAKTSLDAAATQAKTPTDHFELNKLYAYLGAQTTNGPMQVTAIKALIASNMLTADESKIYKGSLAKGYVDSGDTAGSLGAFRAYIDEYGGTPDQLIGIANDSSKAGDNATAATYAEKAIAASPTPAPESWYRLYMRSLQSAGQEAKYYIVMESIIVKFPKEEYWRILLGRVQKEPNFSKTMYLDLYRALQESGATLTPQERGKAADEAVLRGLPGEALSLLEAANARGEVTSDLDKKNLATARSQSNSDRASLAKDTKTALTKGSASELALLGEAQLSYGDNEKAIEVLKAALAKGIADPNALAAAKLHLGIAQYRAGDKAAAKATWADVKSDDGAGMLAHNWSLIADMES